MTDTYTAARLAERLRILRVRRGLTLADVGRMIGRSASAVSGYETGRRYPDPETLLRLMEIYEVNSAPDLFNDPAAAGDRIADEHESNLIGLWRAVDDESRAAVMAVLKRLAKERK